MALCCIGPTFWEKKLRTLTRTENLNIFKLNVKKYFLNERKSSNNTFKFISIFNYNHPHFYL